MTPHEQYRASKNLLAEQFNRPTTEEGNLLSRAGMLPLGVYDTGVGFAWPSSVVEPAQSINRLMTNGYHQGDAEAVGDVTNALTSVFGGSVAFGRPFNALGAGGRPRIKFSDDQESAMLRMIYEGRPLREIADTLGVSHSTVSLRYREYGIAARGKGGPGIERPQTRALPPELEDQLAKAKLNGISSEQLQKDYGVGGNTVVNALNRWRDRNPDKATLPTIRSDSNVRWSHDLD